MSDLPKYQNNETTRIIENSVPFSMVWISGFTLTLTAVVIIGLIAFAIYSKVTLRDPKLYYCVCGIYCCILLLHIVFFSIGIVYISTVLDNSLYNLGADCFNKQVNDSISPIDGLSVGVLEIFIFTCIFIVPAILVFCIGVFTSIVIIADKRAHNTV